ncbi:MAG: hypothetical protein GY950_20880, partial [bacterium]|nr:hypothetical protein [bacterium]
MRERFLLTMVTGIFIMGQSLFHYALDPQKKMTQYVHDVWGLEKGLPQNTVEAIIQTRDGYLWLGTLEGLVRFDGVHFKVFDKRTVEQILDNRIKSLYEDRKGNLWVGTNGGGLTCLNSKDGKFTTYTKKQGLSSNRIRTIYEDRQGSLWIGTEGGGLNRMKDGKFTRYSTKEGLAKYEVMAICEDRAGRLWIGTAGGGLNRMKDGKFTRYSTKEGLSNDNVMDICEDCQGDLWIGTRGGGVNRLSRLAPDKGEFTITRYTTKEGLANNIVRSIYQDREGCLWIGTKGGLNRMDCLDSHKKDGKFTFNVTAYTTKEGLSNNMIRSLYEDREGSLWIGTDGGGLNRLKDGKFTTYTTKQGLSDNLVWSIHEDRKGSLWIGTIGGGLNCLDRRESKQGKFTFTITAYTTKEGLSNNVVRTIYEDREGSLWIGTGGGGLNRLDRRDSRKKNGKFIFEVTAYSTEDGLTSKFIRCIFVDRGGTLWVGTYGGGLNRLDSKKEKFTAYTTKEGLSSDLVLSINEDRKGNLWIGTEGGLHYLDRADSRDEKFTVYTTKEGLSNNVVRSLYLDQEGDLWIGTYGGGLNRMKDGKFTGFTTKEGLFDDTVHQVLEDDRGNLWMGCNKGVFRVSKKELNDFADGKISGIHCVSYDEKDGMASRECNGVSQPSGWKSRDGKLWFPTVKGVVMIDPNNINLNRLPPPVKIEAITT